MTTPVSPDSVRTIESEFRLNSTRVFGTNLHFSFIFGGMAKGYADSRHDIDMFVCLRERNQRQEKAFIKFYFDLHNRHRLSPDHLDPVEFATLDELQSAFSLLTRTKIRRIIRSFEEYEAIVWGDVFSGTVSATIGDLDLLASLQKTCSLYPNQWRSEILALVDQNTLEHEGRLLPGETIESLNTTRLFRRCITYLKRPEPAEAFQGREDRLHVCMLGGGGNVAEAVTAHLCANGHRVSQFRFDEHIDVPGVPKRPKRSAHRLKTIQFANVSGQDCPLENSHAEWIEMDQFEGVDVFVLGYPSFMMEQLADRIGTRLANKPLINLPDRFLGSYALLSKIADLHGEDNLPLFSIGFNGVPIMALKENRDAPTSIYYVKPKHSIAWYPYTRKREVYSLLSILFHLRPDQLIPYPSMLHLAIENAHCVEHAVADLYNLKQQQYHDQGGGFLYSRDTYTKPVVDRIREVIFDRDRIAQRLTGKTFYSLSEYDIRVFGGNKDDPNVGSSEFRVQHPSLSKAPNLMKTTAFGYEDVGWSMVTLESFAITYGIDTPALSELIDDWNAYMGCDYRKIGRTIYSLNLAGQSATNTPKNYKSLPWLPYFSCDMMCQHFTGHKVT